VAITLTPRLVEKLKVMESENYSFSAIRGIQAGREYYVATVSFGVFTRLFIFDDDVLPADMRSQRVLNKARVPDISNYILDNPKEFVFSAITASIDCEIIFDPLGDEGAALNIGTLTIPLNSQIIINDGQHRQAAIIRAMKENPRLRNQTIAVVLFQDKGLRKSQQMFADLNQHAVKPTRSLSLFYDHRNELARLTKRIVEKVPIFCNFTEVEKTTISHRSNKMFTLSNIHQANMSVLRKRSNAKTAKEGEDEIVVDYWCEVTKHIPEWQMVIRKEVSCAELRREFVHAHGVVLHALGIAGGSLLKERPESWKKDLKVLRRIDWSRSSADVWEGRAMIGGNMNKSQNNLILTSNYIKQQLGLGLTAGETSKEKKFMRGSD